MGIETILIRLILIVILSFLLGLEREYNHQPAGLRTHILIGLGAALLMILSINVAGMPGNINGDPGRIAAQVVSGIGFIGAGAIMRTGLNTKGITTAANIWITAAIGLVVGAGLYYLAIISTILILFNLIVITRFKTKLLKQTRYCNIRIEFNKKKFPEDKLIKAFKELPIIIKTKEIKENDSNITIKIVSEINKELDIYSIQSQLRNIGGLNNISVSEFFK